MNIVVKVNIWIVYVAFHLLFMSQDSSAADTRSITALLGNETSHWSIRGEARAVAAEATFRRLTSQTLSSNLGTDQTMSLTWRDATLEADDETDPIRIQASIELQIGRTMPVGETTAYPGLVTVLKDATGRIVDLDSGHVSLFRMENRGTWLGHFVHSDSSGGDHLAVEIPFSLYDETTGALIAQNNLLAGFDLSNPVAPSIYITNIFPTPFSDLRIESTDIGQAVRGKRLGMAQTMGVVPESYTASVTGTKVRTVAGQSEFDDIFQSETLPTFGCGIDSELMELELNSSGLSRLDEFKSPKFTLQLRYAPSFSSNGELAYLDPLNGQLTWHDDKLNRVVEISSGNHGNLASSVVVRGENVRYELGVALREGSSPPIVARMDISCTKTDAGDESIACEGISLRTATAVDGNPVSVAALSSLIEKPFSIEELNPTTFAWEPEAPPADGPTTPCTPGACPTCDTEGCDQGGNCETYGAPVNCPGAGCDHYNGQSQCCRRGAGRVCCVIRCAVAP